MKAGEIGWVIYLAGLPFAPALFRPLDLWQAQALWAQGGVALLFTIAVFSGRVRVVRDLPWGLWSLFTLGWFFWTWKSYLEPQKPYPMVLLIPLCHWLTLVGFYLAACTYWTRENFSRLLDALAWGALPLVVYGYLQALNLDPFFKNLDAPGLRDVVVGTIGNSTHFGTHLALLLPLLWRQKRFWPLTLATYGLLALIVVLHKSVTGAGIAVALGLLALALHRRWVLLGLAGGVVGLVGAWVLTHVNVPLLLSDSGRLAIWNRLSPLFTGSPVTGIGLGGLYMLSQQITQGPLFQWRHAHNEYYQLLIEQGVIGFGFCLAVLYQTVRRVWGLRHDPLAQTCGWLLLTFGLNALVSFPAHLWALGSLGLTAYCGLAILQEA